ncbi:ankyrin repeat-containing domain protein, partial [Baffinella frigidus]
MRADGRKAPMLNLTLQEDLMDAASQGDTLGVLAAVRAGASLESGAGTPYKLSALHLAAGEGHPGTMGVLLRLGMSADPPGDHAGMTPLHRTCDKGKLDAAALLLSAGADPNAKDGSGRTPVHLAAHGGHTTLLRLLALSGGRTKELDVIRDTPLHLAARAHATKELDVIRDTPLHLAAMGGHLEACVFLLDEGCRADDLNRFGVCPLELALSSGRAEAVDLLITHLLAHGAPEGYVLSFKMLHKDQDGMPDLEMPAAKQVFAAGRANEVLSGKVPMRTSGKRGWKQFEGRWGYEAQESAGVGSLGEMAADLDRAVEEEDCESVTSRQFWEGGDDSTGPPQDHN